MDMVSMDTLKVNLTASHIRFGERGKPVGCPVSKAVYDALQKNKAFVFWVVAGSERITANTNPFGRLRALTPDEVHAFIRDFDDGKEVQPFSFELNFG